MTRVIWLGRTKLHIDGIKGIIDFDENSIRIYCGRQELCVLGSKLAIDDFSIVGVDITGNISEIKWK